MTVSTKTDHKGRLYGRTVVLDSITLCVQVYLIKWPLNVFSNSVSKNLSCFPTFPTASSNIWREYPPVCGAAVQHPLIWSGHVPSSDYLRQHRARRTSSGQLRHQQHCSTCVMLITLSSCLMNVKDIKWSYRENRSVEHWSGLGPSHFTWFRYLKTEFMLRDSWWWSNQRGAARPSGKDTFGCAYLNVKNTLWACWWVSKENHWILTFVRWLVHLEGFSTKKKTTGLKHTKKETTIYSVSEHLSLLFALLFYSAVPEPEASLSGL